MRDSLRGCERFRGIPGLPALQNLKFVARKPRPIRAAFDRELLSLTRATDERQYTDFTGAEAVAL
jgi:hypothetical protein